MIPSESTLDELLEKTSRTFALVIPFLPEPMRKQVTLAYLLLRIGDTLEDAESWGLERKVAELAAFKALVLNDLPAGVTSFVDRLRADPPSASAAYLELLFATDRVLQAHHATEPRARAIVSDSVARTLEGMSRTLTANQNGGLRLRSIEELKGYCYIVAGIVGELLTELFVLHAPSLGQVARELRERAVAFGEGLQLTNILKDEREDVAAGRSFLPTGVSRKDVVGLARENLRAAMEYVSLLRDAGAPRGFVEFTSLPVLFAVETVHALDQHGSGAKVKRERVAEIVMNVANALDTHAPLFPSAS
jgi:farnesyl-diphosphate farnesyltransferase